MSVAPMRRTKSLSSGMEDSTPKKRNNFFGSLRGMRGSKSRDNTPTRRRDRSGCEYYDDKMEDGDLPSLKTISSNVNDDEIQSVISRASRLSPSSRRKHQSFWNQLDVDYGQSKDSEDDAPDDEASAYTEARLKMEEEEREREAEKRRAATLERKREMEKKLSEEKEVVQYDSDSDDGYGGLMGIVHRMCSDCEDPANDDDEKQKRKNSIRRKNGANSRRKLEIKLSPSDDDFFENTAIEVEYVNPRSIQRNNSGASGKSTATSRRKEGFLQLDNSGDVSVMVESKKRTPEVITTPKSEESLDLRNVMSDLSEDEDVVRQPVSQKNALLNHLANEAMEEYTKKKQEEASQLGGDSDDELSEILNQWEAQRSTQAKEKRPKPAIALGTSQTQSQPLTLKSLEQQSEALANGTEEDIVSPQTQSTVRTERKSRSLAPPQDENDQSSDQNQNDISTTNHVGEIDKKALQEKLSNGASTPRRIVRANTKSASPARSIASTTSRRSLMPKLKKSSASSKGFAPVMDDDDTYSVDESLTKTGKDADSSKNTSENASPLGVDQFPSPISSNISKSRSYGALDNPTVRNNVPTSKGDVGTSIGPKFKGLNRRKSKKKDSFSSIEKSMLMETQSDTTNTATSNSLIWGGRKKRDKKTNSNWHAIDDGSDEEEEKIEIEQMIMSSNAIQPYSVISTEDEKKIDKTSEDIAEKETFEEEKKDEITFDDMSFTDDKTIATNNIHNLSSPRGLTVGRNSSSLDVSAISSKVGDSTFNDDTKSVYSAVTGLSLASTWSSASTATSTRRRHRGAAIGRTQVPQQKKPAGWYDSIQAAAAQNQRVWDPKRGWIGYVEPDKETNPKSDRIGALSIKAESLKKSPAKIKDNIKKTTQISSIPPPPPPPPPHTPEAQSEKTSNQTTPPGSVQRGNDDSYLDNESLAQPSLASTVTESPDIADRSPLQFYPAKALSMAKTNEGKEIENKWVSSRSKDDNIASKTSSPVENLSEENDSANIAFIGNEYVSSLEANNGDENSGDSLTDGTGGKEYQSLDELENENEDDNSENDYSEENEKGESSNPGSANNDQNEEVLDEALLDDDDLHNLYDWLDHGDDENKRNINVPSMSQNLPQDIDDNNGQVAEENIPVDSVAEPLSLLSLGVIESETRSTDLPPKPPVSSLSKEDFQQIFDDPDNNEFDFADFSRESFEESKNASKQSIDQSLPKKSNSPPPSPFDQNGFKVIKGSTLKKWGQSQSYTSLSDHSGDLDGVQNFSTSDSDEGNDESNEGKDDNRDFYTDENLETLHEVSSTYTTEDDTKSVRTHDTGTQSVNSVSSRAKAWMELMEAKKSKYGVSQRKPDVTGTDDKQITQLSSIVSDKIDENSVVDDVVDDTRSNKNPDETVVQTPVTSTESPTVQSNDKSLDNADSTKPSRALSPGQKAKGPMFISAADDNSFFKFVRENQDDEDTLFSNLDAESAFSKPIQSPRKSNKNLQPKNDESVNSGDLGIVKNPQNEVLSFNNSFDDNTLNTRSTMHNDAQFEINTSFQTFQSEHKPKTNNFFTRVASVCEPIMPGALQCSSKQSAQEAEAVPLAHLAFLQRRSVSNKSRSSPNKFHFVNPEWCGRSGTMEKDIPSSNSQYSENGGRVSSTISNKSKPIEQMSDIGNSSSYLATMAKIKKDSTKKSVRSNVSNASSNNSRSQAWNDFLERRSQTGSKSSKRSNSGVSATAEKYAAKRVEEMMKSLSTKSDSAGKRDVKNILDSMSNHGSDATSDIHPSPPTGHNSSRTTNERFATARVEAMMAVMSSNSVDQAEI